MREPRLAPGGTLRDSRRGGGVVQLWHVPWCEGASGDRDASFRKKKVAELRSQWHAFAFGLGVSRRLPKLLDPYHALAADVRLFADTAAYAALVGVVHQLPPVVETPVFEDRQRDFRILQHFDHVAERRAIPQAVQDAAVGRIRPALFQRSEHQLAVLVAGGCVHVETVHLSHELQGQGRGATSADRHLQLFASDWTPLKQCSYIAAYRTSCNPSFESGQLSTSVVRTNRTPILYHGPRHLSIMVKVV